MKIGGLQKVSLIDYPGKIGAVVFTQGCNFRCPYCHNPELVNPTLFRETIPEESVIAFLKTRRGKLEAVTVTGGEPTLQEGLPSFLQRIKDLGFLVKIDTNGSFPAAIAILLQKGLVDYFAMDIKGPLDKYEILIHARVKIEDIKESIALITGSSVSHEFRTTLAASLLTGKDILEIAGLIPSARRYVLQRFVPSKLLDSHLRKEVTFGDKEINDIKCQLEKNLSSVTIR
ncbi:MAG TPA: anaerobic ribonucleoside-triphosphate reductase activating protein [Syntrophus sp. (in: bacteria)]|jgi:pyruvate formate lyase activating enzyme|nr:anaerobic ribonucleoside-triphosphate reductase activating protein [Syntrophus sp. (in: bacteria)]